MKIDKAISEVRQAESELARHLRKVGERHAVEQDVYHLGHTLARQCAENLQRLAPFAEHYGTTAGDDDVAESPGLVETLRHKSAQLLGRHEVSGLHLLRDLRELYLSAQHAEIAWVILVQAARAARDQELFQVARQCHEDAEVRGKWLRTRIKETAPQVLATG